MTKYILISKKGPGHLSFIYDSNGWLVEFSINSWDVEPERHKGMLMSLGNCFLATDMLAWAAKHQFEVKKLDIDLSFERFMNMYGFRRDTGRAEKAWKRLNQRQQYWKFIELKCYLAYIRRSPKYNQMYPQKFITGSLDDWDKMKDFK